MSYWNQFSPPIIGQSQYGADSSGVLNGGYDDDLDSMLNPQAAPQLSGGANSRPGILQDPASTQALGEAWAIQLSGLKSAQLRAEKQRTYDDKHEFWDQLAGQVLFPASGAIPGNRKHAIDASSAIMDDLAKRQQARRDDQGTQMQLMTGLAKVIKGADPEDMDNILAQRKLDMQLDRESRLGRQGDMRMKLSDERVELTRQKQYADGKRKDDIFAWQKSDKAHVRAEGRLRMENWVKFHNDSMKMQEKRLMQQREIAGQMMDIQTIRQIDREIDALADRQDALHNMEQDSLKFDAEQEKTATAVNAKGQLKNPGYQKVARPVAPMAAQAGKYDSAPVRPGSMGAAPVPMNGMIAPPKARAMRPPEILKALGMNAAQALAEVKRVRVERAAKRAAR